MTIYPNQVIYGSPLPAQNWPQFRGIPRILHLHRGPREWGDKADLSVTLEKLPYAAVAVDIGTGSGRVPQHIGSIRPDLHWCLVSATELEPSIRDDMFERGSDFYYCFVPKDGELLKNNYGHCSLIMDTYGAVTYDPEPDKVLLLYALLLDQGGTASMLVSTTDDTTPTHVFTHDETLQKIAEFLDEKLGVSLMWCAKSIASEAKPGTFCTDFVFRMTAHKPKEKKDPSELFSQLTTLLREQIGTPHINRNPWYSAGDFQIVSKEYIKESDAPRESVLHPRFASRDPRQSHIPSN